MSELRNATDLHKNVQYIKDTYPKLFDRLCEVWEHATNSDICYGFDWRETNEEIGRFWLEVDRRDWEAAKEMIPKYFEQPEQDMPKEEHFDYLEEVEAFDDVYPDHPARGLLIAKVKDKFICIDPAAKKRLDNSYEKSHYVDIRLYFYDNIRKIQKPEFKVGDRVIAEFAKSGIYGIGTVKSVDNNSVLIRTYTKAIYTFDRSELIEYTPEKIDLMTEKYGYRLTFKD